MGFNPKSELAAINARFNVLSAKGADNLTEAEVTELEGMSLRAGELKAAIARGEKSAALMGGVARLDSVDETDLPGGLGGVAHERSTPSGAKGFLTAAGIKAAVRSTAAHGFKALVAEGATVIPEKLDTNPIPLPELGLGLLSFLPTTVRETPAYSYLKQTVKTHAAAIVEPGAQKPTGTYTVSNFDSSLAVFAELSEYIDIFLLEDSDNLERFLTSQMSEGVLSAITAHALDTFSSEAGALAVPYAGSVADTLLTGVQTVAGAGYAPGLIVVNDEDYLALRLSKDAEGRYFGGNVFDGGAMPNIWGQPTFVTPHQTAGEALVIDPNQVGISTDGKGYRVAWDSATRFDYNETRARVETRAQAEVFNAKGIAKLELTSGE